MGKIFQISFITSSSLTIVGIVLVIFSGTPGLLVVGFLAILVGIIQIIADLGWIAITKVNRNLDTWDEAYQLVTKQREQKFFLFPIYMDILFIIICFGTIFILKL